MSVTYAEFLERRAQDADGDGFEPTYLPDAMFGFQRDLTAWALRRGRAALFADCGLGKTLMEMTWADNVHRFTGRPVLVVTPLAVGFQWVAEAQRFGFDAAQSRDGTVVAPLTVTNYERLERFDPDAFAAVVCDESSAIKAFDGTRRATVTEFVRRHRFRLLATATAAPNDYVELGTSSEALGVLGHIDMLNRFFVNDARTSDTKRQSRARHGKGASAGWRFKGHAEVPFWRWVSSWARAVRRPSDLGHDDDGFVLPPLRETVTVIDGHVRGEHLFPDGHLAVGLAAEREELRATLDRRCATAAELVAADSSPAVVWCHLNDESKRLARLIPDAVEVSGSDPPDEKEAKLRDFTEGRARVLVTKPRIAGWGLNWQHCHRVVYFPSHSYEQYYQAVRRCWRFGQTRPVQVDLVTTTTGRHVLDNLHRKSAAADTMFDALLTHMHQAQALTITDPYHVPEEIPAWLSPISR